MTPATSACRVAVGLGLWIAPLLAFAQRPVISSCLATPSALAPGGTASVRVRATSPAGLPLQYVYSATAGTVVGDGDSAAYTADASTTGVVAIVCEVRDSHEGWVRTRAYIKMNAAAAASPNPAPTLGAAAPKASTAGTGPGGGRAATPSGAAASPASTLAAKPAPAAAKTAPAPLPAASTHAQPPPKPTPQPAASTPQRAVAQPMPVPAVPPPAPTPPPAALRPAALPDASVAAAPPASQADVPIEESPWSKSGAVDYKVPQLMVAGVASEVTVEIHGRPDQDAATPAAGRTQVTQYMKVLLLAENGGQLHIVPRQDTDILMVPKDGTARWAWDVTPGTAARQTMQVRVYREFKADSEQPLDAVSYTVNVTAPSSLAVAKRTYIDDPDAWWKYWIPAGSVCALLAALCWRALQRRKRARARAAHKVYVSDWS